MQLRQNRWPKAAGWGDCMYARNNTSANKSVKGRPGPLSIWRLTAENSLSAAENLDVQHPWEQ
jgi:hypothetical protein